MVNLRRQVRDDPLTAFGARGADPVSLTSALRFNVRTTLVYMDLGEEE